MINALEGFDKVTYGMILNWKKPSTPSSKRMGRQVDGEFEAEVLRECERMSNNHMQNGGAVNSCSTGSGAVAATFGLTYAAVRECASNVMERLYVDEAGDMVPRWKLNSTTRGLKFSHKWVIGLLQRVQKSGPGAGLVLSDALAVEEEEEHDSEDGDSDSD